MPVPMYPLSPMVLDRLKVSSSPDLPTLRHLLHLGGRIDYAATAITVALDRPDSPRVACALDLLTQELNATPAHLPGDRRPLTYQVTRP
jgi:hypothetical protein